MNRFLTFSLLIIFVFSNKICAAEFCRIDVRDLVFNTNGENLFESVDYSGQFYVGTKSYSFDIPDNTGFFTLSLILSKWMGEGILRDDSAGKLRGLPTADINHMEQVVRKMMIPRLSDAIRQAPADQRGALMDLYEFANSFLGTLGKWRQSVPSKGEVDREFTHIMNGFPIEFFAGYIDRAQSSETINMLCGDGKGGGDMLIGHLACSYNPLNRTNYVSTCSGLQVIPSGGSSNPPLVPSARATNI